MTVYAFAGWQVPATSIRKGGLMKQTILAVLLLIGLGAAASAQETEATRLLEKRNAEFSQEIIKLTDDVYVAVGYSVSPVSMVIGSEGIIIVDTGMGGAPQNADR